MLFNSNTFLLFLPIVFILYWFFANKNLRLQNFLILVASYIFYGWWDWRFLFLIAFSTVLDFISGKKIYNAENKNTKKWWLAASIITNLGLLGFFKYYNFFANSFINAVGSLGYEMDAWTLNIILPVGISFYTFQTMSYSLDIYKGKLKPSDDIIDFGAYVSFFPQLVAGPIERATHLLPQIMNKRKFNYLQAVEGMRLILWGMFKKVVIADSLAHGVNQVFNHYTSYSGATLLLSTVFFAFQIYCDFSGYSDIAIGISKLFGFELMSNFKFPYFSKNITEFWKRWHISLSTWFRDYVYIPLGGSKEGKFKALRNIFVVFVVSGFWHGANWTFLAWGTIHGLLYIPVFFFRKDDKDKNTENSNKVFNVVKQGVGILTTFSIVTIAWLFFRCESIAKAFDMLKKMVWNINGTLQYAHLLKYVLALVFIEILIRKDERDPVPFKQRSILRKAFYSILLITIALHWNNDFQEFIYFQF